MSLTTTRVKSSSITRRFRFWRESLNFIRSGESRFPVRTETNLPVRSSGRHGKLYGCFLAASDGTLPYENGAKVSTAFVTNMLGDLKVWVSELLTEKIKSAIASSGNIIPKYSYPDEVFKATDSGVCAELKIDRADTLPVCALDCQRPHKKGVFGRGLLLTGRATKAVQAAKGTGVIRWALSEREKSMIAELEKASARKAV